MCSFLYVVYNRLFPLKLRLIICSFSGKVLYIRRHKELMRVATENKVFEDQFHNELSYIKKNKTIKVFNYDYADLYDPSKITVVWDKEKKMNYVETDQKKIYYPQRWSQQLIKITHNALLIERDARSPHCYFDNKFQLDEESCFLDIGAAEGLVSLSIIDLAKKVYLFECNEEWIQPLIATFEPWKDKVVIVNKYVSDTIAQDCITLDSYLGNDFVNNQIFIKCDIEGAESKFLSGAEHVFRNNHVKCAICTYHGYDDEKVLRKEMEEYGCTCSASEGYMVFPLVSKMFQYPYFRRGLLRAENKSERVTQ